MSASTNSLSSHSPQSWQSVFINANIATMNDGAKSYGAMENAALAVSDGKIAWIGAMQDLVELNLADFPKLSVIDVSGQWLLPGLVDCHTHIVYGGHRANEFELRLQGASYEEVAKAGGGIVSTVKATRAASEEQLFNSALPRLNALQSEGVTTIEIKSGYGLDTETELKMLTVAKRLGEQPGIEVRKTFLGAHALPVEYADNADGYIDLVCNEMLPAVAADNLADAVDVFCEGIGFDIKQTERVFQAAKQHKIAIKVHAEQLSDLGGTALAAKYQALSSDHLEYLSEESIKAMQQADMAAVLLPGAFYFLRETKLPPIDRLREHGVAIALATDANPGSSPIHSIQLMLNMACTLFRLTPTEAIAGVTCHGAKALGLADNVGSLEVGKQADIAVFNVEQVAQLCYQYGVNPLASVYKAGVKIV
ncbi:imidazolonepropionase [Thalassotalea litorea]|uniref:Imidazolonepropionase n=1 Tax=Thalassotalea litorea TaxID=2020715 RepID=A0A5R9INL5_9GAMM|nr:imidazolonepropionase [Thalassotalea litorea]TLU67134.1 imidazolonepropionase [Thalassotalea litorea]